MFQTNAVVIGYGVVGKATAKALGIRKYIDHKGSNTTLAEAAKCRYIFLCLPTPVTGETHDMGEIVKTIADLNYYPGERIYIVRSTTTPGQLSSLGLKNVVHYPEFLTMKTADQDASNPDIVVVGECDLETGIEVAELLKKRFPKAKHFLTDITTSELTKCAINNFYALKVIFANEMYDFANEIGADYEAVKDAMYERKWIGANHLEVIFHGERGVRGACLPKELKAMTHATGSPLLEIALKLNEKYVK